MGEKPRPSSCLLLVNQAKINREDIVVETIDLGSVQGADGDYYVTTNELFDNFPDGIKERTIVLNNFIDLAAIESALEERIGL